jgi:hypothetical protein
MRFLILTSVVALGAAVVGAILPASYADQIASTAHLVKDGAAKVIADPSELNPIRWVFDGVQHQVEANAKQSSLFVGTPVATPTFPTVTPSSQFHLDESVMQRGQFAGNRGMPPR